MHCGGPWHLIQVYLELRFSSIIPSSIRESYLNLYPTRNRTRDRCIQSSDSAFAPQRRKFSRKFQPGNWIRAPSFQEGETWISIPRRWHVFIFPSMNNKRWDKCFKHLYFLSLIFLKIIFSSPLRTIACLQISEFTHNCPHSLREINVVSSTSSPQTLWVF